MIGISLLFTFLCQLPNKLEDVPNYLQEISVTVKSNTGSGSGVIVVKGHHTFVVTAAHVVDGLRRTREVIDPNTGIRRVLIEFGDAEVYKDEYEGGRRIGSSTIAAKILKYSNADHGQDLAILHVRKKHFAKVGAVFYLDGVPPRIGSQLYHVGSLLGPMGSNSFTTGNLSQIGRLLDGRVYDQTSVVAFPGSSGGGVYLTDGRVVGFILRGAGETFNLMRPTREAIKWADKANIKWVFDSNLPAPSDADLEKIVAEDIGVQFGGPHSQNKLMPPTRFKKLEENNSLDMKIQR